LGKKLGQRNGLETSRQPPRTTQPRSQVPPAAPHPAAQPDHDLRRSPADRAGAARTSLAPTETARADRGHAPVDAGGGFVSKMFCRGSEQHRRGGSCARTMSCNVTSFHGGIQEEERNTGGQAQSTATAYPAGRDAPRPPPAAARLVFGMWSAGGFSGVFPLSAGAAA